MDALTPAGITQSLYRMSCFGFTRASRPYAPTPCVTSEHVQEPCATREECKVSSTRKAKYAVKRNQVAAARKAAQNSSWAGRCFDLNCFVLGCRARESSGCAVLASLAARASVEPHHSWSSGQGGRRGPSFSLTRLRGMAKYVGG